MEPRTLDHVAFWVSERDAIADYCVRHLGMHVVDRQDDFTLVGSDARHGKLTLFDAQGPRERGAFEHVALRSRDPEATARAYLAYGFNPAEPKDGVPRVEVGGAYVEFHRGDPGGPERPLLNHIAVLVDSAEQHRQDAEDAGIEVERFVDAANTLAVFLFGPDRVRIEYVEHKPTFSLT